MPSTNDQHRPMVAIFLVTGIAAAVMCGSLLGVVWVAACYQTSLKRGLAATAVTVLAGTVAWLFVAVGVAEAKRAVREGRQG